MKELTIKEKAEAYDKAIEAARCIYNNMKDGGNFGGMEDLEVIFPELAEPNDEKIRKALINGFNKLDKSAVWYNGITNAQILDWLEKQANHANFRNKIEVGDKVTRNRDGVLVNLSQLNRVAKVEEKQGEQKPQRMISAGAKEAMYDKPAWSEEDKDVLEDIEEAIINYWHGDTQDILLEWLKSLKDRVQPKQEWSEEDNKHLESILIRLDDVIHNTFTDTCYSVNEDVNWLKSLRHQNNSVTDEELAQAKKEAYNEALDKIEYHSGNPTFDDGWSAAIWYLKKKNVQLRSQWKPSDEQMNAFDAVLVYNPPCSDECRNHLITLYNELKKLKG